MTALAIEPGRQRTAGRRPRPLTQGQLRLPDEPRTAGRKDGLGAHVLATVDAGVRVLLVEQATAGRADSPESVHQMRVSARRMRVALRMALGAFGPKGEWLRTELSWLGSLLGEVRDLDVLCERLGAEAVTLPEADLPAFGDVLNALLELRGRAAEELVAALGRPRYRSLLRALADAAARPADARSDTTNENTADELLARPLRALRKAAAKREPTDEDWHALRIKVKRVRYAAELAGRLAGRKRRDEVAEVVRQAKTAQEVLGAFQDTVVAEDHLRRLLTRHLSPSGWLVLGRLVERQMAHRDALRAQLPAVCAPLSG
ncbi:MAG TPA: CHAD domain-containing protein [Pseudonocardiaceae bacterium]|nr:CHAD domain-containing protein [Pseudonocardiaceae bacterium]